LTHFDFYFGSNFDNNKNDFLSVKDKAIAPTYNFHYTKLDVYIDWVCLGKITLKKLL